MKKRVSIVLVSLLMLTGVTACKKVSTTKNNTTTNKITTNKTTKNNTTKSNTTVHNHNLVKVIDKEATYLAEGSMHMECSICDYKEGSKAISKLEQLTPTYELPTLNATFGQTLEDITLPDGFSFQDELTKSVGDAGENKFLLTYKEPNDEVCKYKEINDIEVIINVSKADIVDINLVNKNIDAEFNNNSYKLDLNNINITNAKKEDLIIKYKKQGQDDTKFTFYIPKEIGEYVVRLEIAETNNLIGKYIDVDFKITKGNPNLVLDDIEVDYTGTNFKLEKNYFSLNDGVNFNVEYKNDLEYSSTAPTKAGEYTIRITTIEDDLYYSDIKTAKLTIKKLNVEEFEPTLQELYVGQKLNDLNIKGETTVNGISVSGKFVFTNDKITKTSEDFEYSFIPNDNNINGFTSTINIIATQLIISVSCGDNGSCSVNGNNNVDYNSNFSLAFIPNTGYGIKELKVDGLVFPTSNTYTFERIIKNHTISVEFEELKENYNVIFDVGYKEYGIVKFGSSDIVNINEITDSRFKSNTIYTLKVEALEGYHIMSACFNGKELLTKENQTYLSASFTLLSDSFIDIIFEIDQ